VNIQIFSMFSKMKSHPMRIHNFFFTVVEFSIQGEFLHTLSLKIHSHVVKDTLEYGE
jgi:hypothetical protein